VILTATGTTGTQLSALRVGDAVSVTYRLASGSGNRVDDAITRGHRYVDGSYSDGGSCSTRDEQLRPRTALAWNAAGDTMVVTVSGRAVVNGVMYGGATHHQMPTYLRQLGAVRAVGLDGGGSTTMYVRSTLSGSPYRVDRPSTSLRPVPTALIWR
jgi:exopolysaccharide biosynthesis protein